MVGADSRKIDSSGRTLLVAFGVVAAAFIISTAIADRSDIAIRRAAELLAGDAAPSVEHLSLLRTDLRRITLLGDVDVDAALRGRPHFDRNRIDNALAALEKDWKEYRGLPSFPGESDLVRPAEQAKEEVVHEIGRIEQSDQSGDEVGVQVALEKELQPMANRLDTAVLHLIDFNAARVGDLGVTIDRLGRRAVINAIVLDGISLALTLATSFLAWRLGRRYTALLERRSEELEAFAGRVAHDVIGPLSAARLALDLLARGSVSPERAARAVEAGRSGIRHARLISDGLLAFARAGAQPEAGAHTDVADVVAGVIEEISQETTERNIAIVSEVEAGAEAACDAGVLASVVSNLLRNAVKYAGGGSSPRIVIRVQAIEDRTSCGCIRIEVEDNGPGLPVDLGDRAFDPYVRGSDRSQPGIGLGLATVKRIAEAHGGSVTVRSVRDAGCTFIVELPAATAQVKLSPRTRAFVGNDRDAIQLVGPPPP